MLSQMARFSFFIISLVLLTWTLSPVRIDSSTMKATATDSLSDCISTTVVLISMLVYQLWHVNLDGWSGIIVAVFILKRVRKI